MDYCEAFPLLFMVSTAREVSEPEAVPIRHKFRESESACGSQSSIYNHKFLFQKIFGKTGRTILRMLFWLLRMILPEVYLSLCAFWGSPKGEGLTATQIQNRLIGSAGFETESTQHLVVGMILRIDSRMQIPTPGICVESERPLVRRLPER